MKRGEERLPATSDASQKREIWHNRPVYSLPVRIGNWYEDLYVLEEELRLAGYQRDQCKVPDKKTCKMFKNLLTRVNLAPETPCALYGSYYQIQACDLPNKMSPEPGSKAACGLYLSGLMIEADVELGNHFLHGCGLTASPGHAPCVRNVFVFMGCNGQADGQTICYGDDVYIRINESGIDGHLFVQCENPTCDGLGGHLKLRLTQCPDLYCRFKVYHCNPELRMKTIGCGFAPNSKVIIQHTATGQNLAAEYGHWIQTYFGAECEVSCHSFRDCHKREMAENMWKIVSFVEPDKSCEEM